jgi:hypothetical protein
MHFLPAGLTLLLFSPRERDKEGDRAEFSIGASKRTLRAHKQLNVKVHFALSFDAYVY